LCGKADTQLFQRTALHFTNANAQHDLLTCANFHQVDDLTNIFLDVIIDFLLFGRITRRHNKLRRNLERCLCCRRAGDFTGERYARVHHFHTNALVRQKIMERATNRRQVIGYHNIHVANQSVFFVKQTHRGFAQNFTDDGNLVFPMHVDISDIGIGYDHFTHVDGRCDDLGAVDGNVEFR